MFCNCCYLYTIKKMGRQEEILILIDFLKRDVIKTSNLYPSLLTDKIVKNGYLIEKYTKEYEQNKPK